MLNVIKSCCSKSRINSVMGPNTILVSQIVETKTEVKWIAPVAPSLKWESNPYLDASWHLVIYTSLHQLLVHRIQWNDTDLDFTIFWHTVTQFMLLSLVQNRLVGCAIVTLNFFPLQIWICILFGQCGCSENSGSKLLGYLRMLIFISVFCNEECSVVVGLCG